LKRTKSKKAQVFSIDFMFSSAIVLFLLVTLIILTDSVSRRLEANELDFDSDESTLRAGSVLLESAGYPFNWENVDEINTSNVQKLGLVQSRNVLDHDKAVRFFNLSRGSQEYNETRLLLGLTRQNYLYNATLKYLNGTTLMEMNASPEEEYFTYGYSYVTTRTARLVYYNKTIMRFDFNVWKE